MEKVLVPDMRYYTVQDLDNYILDHWQYFNNSNSGYSSNVVITSSNHPYSNKKINTMHNCKGFADGLFCAFQRVSKEEFAARPHGDPYEYYQIIKNKQYDKKWPTAGVSKNPAIGAQAIYGKKSPNSDKHYSHIGVVVAYDANYIWIAEDNLNTIRSDYNGGGKSRNGIRKVKRGAAMGTNYPFIGYVLPKKECVYYLVFHNTARLNIREQPSTQSRSIRVLSLGEELHWYSEENTNGGKTWYKVNANGTQGWVVTDYIK